MALSLVTPVTVEPLTLDEAKAQCRVEVDDDDDLFYALIIAARQYGESFTHRALPPQTWDLGLCGGFPCGAIEVPLPPVTSIVSVTYVDSNGTTQTLTPTTQYVTIVPAGPKAMPARITPAYAVPWPPTRRIENAVTVRFTAGYSGTGTNAMPEAIKQAMKLLIGHWYANRESVVVGTISTTLQMTVDALLWPYKVF
jgi:uncharacterized phiE125 gp8 family phage protein